MEIYSQYTAVGNDKDKSSPRYQNKTMLNSSTSGQVFLQLITLGQRYLGSNPPSHDQSSLSTKFFCSTAKPTKFRFRCSRSRRKCRNESDAKIRRPFLFSASLSSFKTTRIKKLEKAGAIQRLRMCERTSEHGDTEIETR